MILSDWVARLRAANIFYVSLAAPHFADGGTEIVICDEDLTGATLLAQIREHPDKSGAPLGDFSINLLSVEDKTWDSLVTDGLLTSVPPGEVGTTSIKVSTVRLTISAAGMAKLPASSVITGGGVTLFYDLRITRPNGDVFIACAGDFKLAQGVSQIS